MSEKPKRSIAKAISWRVVATLTTMGIVFFSTGELALTVSVGIFDVILKLLFYYLHERTWNLVTWGQSAK